MEQITPHIYQLSLGMVNAFIVEDNGLTLIDTGVKNSADKIFAALKKAGKDPADLKRIILTHSHPDHSGSAAEIKKRLGIPVLAHKTDALILEKGIGVRRTKEKPMIQSPGFMNWLIYNLFLKRSDSSVEPLKTDEYLNDGDILPIAGGIEVIHTPGHCAGHIALLLKGEGTLIAGDICSNMSGLGLSIAYEDPELGLKSILKASKHDFDKAVFGHGKAVMQDAAVKMRKKFTPKMK